MLEDRIIVQDRGIDAGLAALIQNANKGNMDPAALMAMMNNGGFGGNGGWWWIWIILIFFCWGGFGGIRWVMKTSCLYVIRLTTQLIL